MRRHQAFTLTPESTFEGSSSYFSSERSHGLGCHRANLRSGEQRGGGHHRDAEQEPAGGAGGVHVGVFSSGRAGVVAFRRSAVRHKRQPFIKINGCQASPRTTFKKRPICATQKSREVARDGPGLRELSKREHPAGTEIGRFGGYRSEPPTTFCPYEAGSA
jgi:hypothetical protein